MKKPPYALDRRAVLFLSIAAAASAIRQPAYAQVDWPKGEPLKLLVPFSAGSAVDAVARAIAPELGRLLGTAVIVDNRPGAGGAIGTAAMVRAPANGYTVMIQSSALVINPSFIPKLGYDTLRDISGVAPIGSTSFVMVTSPESGLNSVQDVIARAKAQPGKLTYGSGGIGSGSHLSSAKLAASAGVDVLHAASRGTSEALTETMAGRLDWVFAPAPAVLQLVRSSRLRALAVSTTTRSSALPEVPSMTESGFAAAAYTPWIGAFVAAKTPRHIVEKLNKAVLQVTEMPAVKERLDKLGTEPMPMSSVQFDKLIADDLSAMTTLVKVAKIKLE